MLRRPAKALPHGRRSLAPDDHGRSRGRGARARTTFPRRTSLEAALEGLRGEIELPIPTASAVKIGGERAYKLHRQGVAVEMPLRRSQVDALDVIAYTDGHRDARSACQLRDVRPVDRRCARRPLRLSAADGSRTVLRRGSRRRARAHPRRGARSDRDDRRRGRGRAAAEGAVRSAGARGEERSGRRRARRAADRGAAAGRLPRSRARSADEDRARTRPARAPAAGCRDRHVRRRSPRAPQRDPGGGRLGARADRDHVRSAPARGIRQRGRADHDARAPAGAVRRRWASSRRSWRRSRPS